MSSEREGAAFVFAARVNRNNLSKILCGGLYSVYFCATLFQFFIFLMVFQCDFF